MVHKVEGIIIKSIDYGEGNKILTLYTREIGKIGVMARGAKKTKSRFSAISQLFTYGTFVFYRGSGLGNLTQGDVIESFRGIRDSIYKTAWSAYIVELLDKLTDEEKERNNHLFELLKNGLIMIDEGKDPEIVTRIFELQLLQGVGIRPELRFCSSCQREEQHFVAFSIKEGGILCETCLPKDQYAHIMAPSSIRLLRTFGYLDVTRIGNVDVKKETRRQIAEAIQAFIDAYVGVQIKSRNFLEQIHHWEEEPR